MAIDFNKIVEDFRRLNWRDPGTWPVLPKLAVLLGILVVIPVAAYFVDWQGQLDELERGRQEEAKLKDAYVIKKRQSVNLDLYQQQLREIDTQFGALLRQLPNKSQMDALLVDINQAGLGRGLQFELFKPAQHETMKDFYAELPVAVRVTGSYHDMGQFASDIAQLSRIVTLNDISIHPAGKDSSVLVMDTTAKTFRYLDEEEVAKQKKAAKKPGPGKK